jgi:hypothetical protein
MIALGDVREVIDAFWQNEDNKPWLNNAETGRGSQT